MRAIDVSCTSPNKSHVFCIRCEIDLISRLSVESMLYSVEGEANSTFIIRSTGISCSWTKKITESPKTQTFNHDFTETIAQNYNQTWTILRFFWLFCEWLNSMIAESDEVFFPRKLSNTNWDIKKPKVILFSRKIWISFLKNRLGSTPESPHQTERRNSGWDGFSNGKFCGLLFSFFFYLICLSLCCNSIASDVDRRQLLC